MLNFLIKVYFILSEIEKKKFSNRNHSLCLTDMLKEKKT